MNTNPVLFLIFDWWEWWSVRKTLFVTDLVRFNLELLCTAQVRDRINQSRRSFNFSCWRLSEFLKFSKSAWKILRCRVRLTNSVCISSSDLFTMICLRKFPLSYSLLQTNFSLLLYLILLLLPAREKQRLGIVVSLGSIIRHHRNTICLIIGCCVVKNGRTSLIVIVKEESWLIWLVSILKLTVILVNHEFGLNKEDRFEGKTKLSIQIRRKKLALKRIKLLTSFWCENAFTCPKCSLNLILSLLTSKSQASSWYELNCIGTLDTTSSPLVSC